MINPKNDIRYPANPNRVWGVAKDNFNSYYDRGKIVFPGDYEFLRINTPSYRVFESEDIEKNLMKYSSPDSRKPISTLLPDNIGRNENGTEEIISIFGQKAISYPKPISFIKFFLSTTNITDYIILDFFAGSCSSAHASMSLNQEDGGKRKFIMIQLPELCSENSEAFNAGYKNIADIGKERIRRAGEQIKTQIEQENTQSTLTGSPKPIPDIGFRVFTVDDTNMKEVYYSATEYNQETIEGLIDNLKEDRTDLDLLYQVLLSWGLKLDLTHTTETIDTFTIHHIDPENNSLIACFDSNIPEEVMRKIALMKPLRAVFRDGSFKDSPGKLNIEGIFKTLSPNTTVRVI